MAEKDFVLEELAKIVGPEWVSNDPAICNAYSRDLATSWMLGRARSPDYVVLPSSTKEVAHILNFATRHRIPVHVVSTGVNVRSMHVPRHRSILLDMKRMNRILEINEENMTITVEPYVTFARANAELAKRNMYVPVPGAPSTVSVVANICCFGRDNRGDNKVGWNYRNIVSMECVLPDGSIVHTGSQVNYPSIDPATGYWPYGPGPSFQYLARGRGITPIVTRATIKCWPLGEVFRHLWVCYSDIDAAVKAYFEICRREVTHGQLIYGGHKYNCYAADTAECQYRMNRICPFFILDIGICGTKRRAEYEEKVVRRIAKETGGRIVVDKFKPFQPFQDSHISVAANMCSWGAIRYWGWRKMGPAGAHMLVTEDNMAEDFKTIVRTALEDPTFANPDRLDFDIGSESGWACIGHSGEGAHTARIETSAEGPEREGYIFYPQFGKMALKVALAQRRIGIAQARPTIDSKTLELTYKFRKAIDPEGIMSPLTEYAA